MSGARDSWIAIRNERDAVIRRRRRLQDRARADNEVSGQAKSA